MPSSKNASKSAKAVRAAGKSSPSGRKGGGKGQLTTKRQVPWLAIGAGAVIVALIGALAYNLVPKYQEQAELERFTPSAERQDPSDQIAGVTKVDYASGAGKHVTEIQRVAYDQTPPFGGPHDQAWADCTGVVYGKPIRTENAVHSLEHGAVWITYNPDKVSSDGVDALAKRVEGKQYTFMSPYPGQESPVSLQSWGHQLKLDNPDDERINQFITALRQNQYTYPEVGAACSNPYFDRENPAPFDPTPPGPDAIPMDGGDIVADPAELGGVPNIPGVPSIPGLPGAPGAPVIPETPPTEGATE
ncbi:DUF3105 domain-containing protein [Nocardia puris]|uniref:Uncharacterized protein DUF3105 n=1 Tax=Nocardia puris TaxID=208602 RepID=A0A366D635_9NOCA|nr:DUF3105 domain-containing protein [Nocardia puris]MBF6212236.1 DUF3105 domain-containing protein [Nocardia puris]MBF6370158.1 DUF3105 domain-containing protein [Nocardia puris]MBF6460825.1 DUF3105 domain-containing protein [Nocardia puris]RBO85490.1 uncharacterized protein DUF3105 [Nocardia puris]